MPTVGQCPNCPAGTKDRILIDGRCHYHAANPVPFELNELRSIVASTASKGANKPRKPIKQVSKKLKAAQQEYRTKAIAFKKANPVCQAGLSGCLVHTSEVHHKAGRIGKLLLDETKWLAICSKCHAYITEHSKEAIELGLSQRRNGKV